MVKARKPNPAINPQRLAKIRKLPRLKIVTAKGRTYIYFRTSKAGEPPKHKALPHPHDRDFESAYAILHAAVLGEDIDPFKIGRRIANSRSDAGYRAYLKRLQALNERGYIAAIEAEREVNAPKKPIPVITYFVGGDVGHIKIGGTRNLTQRLRQLQCGSPIPLRVLATAIGGRAVERFYQRKFAEHRCQGEWFERHPDILAEIDRINALAEREAA